MVYKKRIVESELARKLASSGAVVLEGPKACGKTATARQVAASEVLLDVDTAARQAITIDPALVLGGKTPRLIDEWQVEPEVWNHIRRAVDDRAEPGQFIEDLPPWAPHLRSKSRVRSAPKRLFVDPSLAVAALRATPERLLKDLNLLGFLYESLVIRDLRVYAQASDAQVLQYRDNTGLEVDAVVETADGDWAAFEIKLGFGMADEGAASLLKFSQRVDTTKRGKPRALAVIVGSGYGYVRPDGVAVIPIGALGE